MGLIWKKKKKNINNKNTLRPLICKHTTIFACKPSFGVFVFVELQMFVVNGRMTVHTRILWIWILILLWIHQLQHRLWRIYSLMNLKVRRSLIMVKHNMRYYHMHMDYARVWPKGSWEINLRIFFFQSELIIICKNLGNTLKPITL